MYTFKTTEKNKEKGSDYETFSLLYLMGMHLDCDDIQYVLVDCFNDTTGSDKNVDRLWDIQSKGHKTINPKKIGEFLFTLYDNYLSEFPFIDYLLIVHVIDDEYLVDQRKDVFNISNFKERIKNKIELGLHDEYIRRYKITEEAIYDRKKAEAFIGSVKFKVWTKSKSESIKTMVEFNDASIKSDQFYEAIFNEIRDKQSALKNYCIEGIVIENPSEVLQFNKHISKIEITTLLINRIIGAELFTQYNVPPAFVSYLQSNNSEDIIDIIIECNSAISRTFFNKNNRRNIWQLLENIVGIVAKENPKTVQDCLDRIPEKNKENVDTLNDLQLKFFIAKILEGVK